MLGQGERPVPGHQLGHPYEILFVTGENTTPFAVSEGRGVGSAGGLFNAADLLREEFREHLYYTRLEWLVPLLMRIAGAEFPDMASVEREIVSAYRQQFGHDLAVRIE